MNRHFVDAPLEIEVTWEEFSRLVPGNRQDLEPHLRGRALEVLGRKRGELVLAELDAGRTPRLKPVSR